jgi:phospholipid/cholesterol/gamma-HCH transport system substrate-binding protein
VAAILALAAALVLVAIVLFTSGDSYTLRAVFANAGGLVSGGEVRVEGRRVGKVTGIELTKTGQAMVELSIADDRVTPLPVGTRARIRAVGQAGVSNHYVDLAPGPVSPSELADGATLSVAQTDGIVSLDAILSSLDPPARSSIREVIKHSAEIYAGSGARYFNGMLRQFSPALQEIGDVSGQLASDKANLARLIDQAAVASTAVASRRPDLQSAVINTATTMRAIAAERNALSDALLRAPAMLRQSRATFDAAGTAVTELRPTLRDVPAAGGPLTTVLDHLPPALGRTTPVLRELVSQLPDLRRSLAGFVPMQRPTVAALRAASTALRGAAPIIGGLRPYGPDLILGIFNGLIGISTGPYDAAGHYVHLEFTQSPQFLIGGSSTPLYSSQPLVPGLFAVRTGLDARCPGANQPPAPDGSSPWVPDKSTCDPAQNTKGDINRP